MALVLDSFRTLTGGSLHIMRLTRGLTRFIAGPLYRSTKAKSPLQITRVIHCSISVPLFTLTRTARRAGMHGVHGQCLWIPCLRGTALTQRANSILILYSVVRLFLLFHQRQSFMANTPVYAMRDWCHPCRRLILPA